MGMSVEDYINHAKAEHNYEVNEEKQMKKDIKKQQLYHETMYGASSAPLTPINQVHYKNKIKKTWPAPTEKSVFIQKRKLLFSVFHLLTNNILGQLFKLD